MTEHDAYRERLSALLDGELNEEERAETLAHLERCEACRTYFAELGALHEALSEDAGEAPADFAQSVLARLHEEKTGARRRSPARWRVLSALAACAAVAVLAVTAVPGLLRGTQRSDAAAQNTASVTADAKAEEAADGVANGLETEMRVALAGETAEAPEAAEECAETETDAYAGDAPCAPMASMEKADADAGEADETPLVLHGAAAEQWLWNNGVWDEARNAYWVDRVALSVLPEGLRLGETEALARWRESGEDFALVRAAETGAAR